jgi:glycosyltransferase involved in cell wall biosynthesis
MRIAIANWSRRLVGGTEEYVAEVIPALVRAGHSVALWHETDGPIDRGLISLPAGVPAISVAERGPGAALAELRAWGPDVIYVHGLLDSGTERDLLGMAASVFFVHTYHGTCISGSKTFKRPVFRPCSRVFGWPCLAHYFPHGCGGRNPITMLRQYARQSERLALLRCYDAVVTHTEHMCAELAHHGLSARQVSYPVRQVSTVQHALNPEAWRLVCAARMDLLKGGRVLLEALPRVRHRLGRPVWVTFAGDGPERARWEQVAGRVQQLTEGVRVSFVGWIGRDRLDRLLAQTDLLVVPSLWPEPFGAVGPIAGSHGVPAAAFAVGGIPHWLKEGVNGCLAPGARPTASGLADAIVRCLSNPGTYARLREGAFEMATRFRMAPHLSTLLPVLHEAVAARSSSQAARGGACHAN